MAERKVLGQSAPSADTDTDLYTVGADLDAVISSLVVCNRSATPTTFRVAVRPAGAGIGNAHYLAYDTPIGANETIALMLGITLAATDVLTVRADDATLSFSAFGEENDVA